MPEVSIQSVEESSGIKKYPAETTREYLNRVGKRAGLSNEEISQVVIIFEQAQFASQPSLNDEKVEAIQHFHESIRNLSEELERDDSRVNAPPKTDEQQRHLGESTQRQSQPSTGNQQDVSSSSAVEPKSSPQTNGDPSVRSTTAAIREHETIFQNAGVVVERGLGRATSRVREHIVPSAYDLTYITGIFLIGAFFYLRNLGSRSLRNWDEGIYANAAQHMVQSGNWLVPQIEGGLGPIAIHPFLEKPPLAMWLQAISMEMFGFTEFAVRSSSALFTILTAIVIYLFGRYLKSRSAGLISAFVWLSTQHVYVGDNAGRAGATDLPLVFFGTCFVILTWIVAQKDARQYLPLVCLMAGLAVLTKGFSAAAFVFIVAPVVFANIRSFVNRQMLKSVAGFAVLVVPWPLFMWFEYGQQFIYEIFISQVLQRAAGSSFVTREGALFEFMRFPFFSYFPIFFDPWFFFLIPGVIALLAREYLRRDFGHIKDILFLVWWTAFIIVFYAYTGNHGWYVLPMYVPASLLVGWIFSRAIDRDPIVIGAVLVGYALTILFSFRSELGMSIQGTATLPDYGFRTGVAFYAGITLIVVLALGYRKMAALLKRLVTADDYRIGSHIIPLICIFAILLVLMGPTAPWTGPGAHAGESIKVNVPGDETAYLSEEIAQSGTYFSMAYYAQNPIDEATLSQINQNTDIRYALVKESERKQISRNYRVLDEIDWDGKYLLIKLSE